MAVEDLEGEGVNKFIDGDDRKNSLKERPPYVLYLWHITWTYGILNNVWQQLKTVSCLDGNNAPYVSSSWKRKDLSSQSSESGYAVGQDILSMRNSIDGLVRVAQESIKKQGIDSLHWQREVLQLTKKECDETILEIELKIVDADECHVAICEKALSKKQMELQEKKEELEEITSAIIKENEEYRMSTAQVLFKVPNNDELSFSSTTKSAQCTTPIGRNT